MEKSRVAKERKFWVVSPNVNGDYHTVRQWQSEITRRHAAFMGWPPDKRIGSRFAQKIKSGDIILIARRHHRKPEIVGFGVVRGKLKNQLPGFKPPGKFGSLWKLFPFKEKERLPVSLNVMSVLGQTAALRHIRRSTHEKICNWLERQLPGGKDIVRGSDKISIDNKNARVASTRAILAKLPQDNQLEYIRRTRKAISRAKKIEAELVKDYCGWLEARGKTLEIVKTGKLRCDGYEENRGNLIEAKSKVGREYIRMAVGQLFDYVFLGRTIRSNPNLAILLPAKPATREIEWLNPLKISVIWRQKGKFKDNAGNRFC
jgi:hypothetical protein